MITQFQNNAIFWVEVDKIRPNPYQPRREFDEERLKDLAESIRQYGVLQPLVVTRYEIARDDGGLSAGYELIAGERRLRASKLAGILEVPVIIRSGEEGDRMKLELAIIENIQREDLNPIDRAHAFDRLVREFGFSHGDVGRKVGKSRVYVTNTLRILGLPDEMKQAVVEGKIVEGHTRPLLMLTTRPEEQATLFKEIVHRQITVRDAEEIARRIAKERARKKEFVGRPDLLVMEERLAEMLGTRVHIQQREGGGKILIDFFSPEDLEKFVALLNATTMLRESPEAVLERLAAPHGVETPASPDVVPVDTIQQVDAVEVPAPEEVAPEEETEDLYSVKNFSI